MLIYTGSTKIIDVVSTIERLWGSCFGPCAAVASDNLNPQAFLTLSGRWCSGAS
jgi:hypothetical protein